MDTMQSIKAALDAWIAEQPEVRKYKILTPALVAEILAKAQQLEAKCAQLDRMGA